MPGTLFVIATPIGNLEDISMRALRILREVALIAAEDTRRTSQLLARYSVTTSTTSLHQHNERQKTSALINRLNHGDSVALVSDAGTPGVSDPGQHLIQSAIEAGIKVEPIPGPSAVMAALSVSGFGADVFTFLGFPPVKAWARQEWFDRLRKTEGTVVFFEAPHRIIATLDELRRAMGNLPVVLCREMTKAHETFVRGPISTVAEAVGVPKGELVVVLNIGQSIEQSLSVPPSDHDLALEMGEMIEHMAISRRKAIQALARRHRIPANEVYRAIERWRKLV